MCYHRCRSFPVRDVANNIWFDKGANLKRFCIPAKKVMEILLKRPGGRECLISEKIVRAYGKCKRVRSALNELGLTTPKGAKQVS